MAVDKPEPQPIEQQAAFHREGGKLLATVTVGPGNTTVIEIEKTLPDGTVKQNPDAYARLGKQIDAFRRGEKSVPRSPARAAAPPAAPDRSIPRATVTHVKEPK